MTMSATLIRCLGECNWKFVREKLSPRTSPETRENDKVEFITHLKITKTMF